MRKGNWTAARTSQTVTAVTITLLQPAPPRPELPTATVPQCVGAGKTSNRMARILAVLQEEPSGSGGPERSPSFSATSPSSPVTGNSPTGPRKG